MRGAKTGIWCKLQRMKKLSGQIQCFEHESEVLKSNPLRDPHVRQIYVYSPAEAPSTKKLPALMALVGFGGTGAQLLNVDPFGEDLATRMDRLIASGACPPVRIVIPDCFTRVGGNQYINSTATGAYEDYLLKEIVPFIGGHVGISHWGVFGKSSGGFGSIALGLRNPEIFKVFANHSGDSNFELSYLPDFPSALDEFKKAGGPEKWLDKMWKDPNPKRKKYHKPLNMLAMAAHYSPNPKSPDMGIDFPFDLETGIFKPEVWSRWQAWDPVRLLYTHAENAKKLKLLFIDCGSNDEFALHWGARAQKAICERARLPLHFEEFEDGHMNIQYRYDVSIPLLAKTLHGI